LENALFCPISASDSDFTGSIPACPVLYDGSEGNYMKMKKSLPGRPPIWAGNFDPPNTQCIPVVKIFVFFELEQN